MEKIARPIGPADMEHYEGVYVMTLAKILSGRTDIEWVVSSYRSKVHWINKATKVLVSFLNDKAVVERLPMTLKCLQERNK